MSKVDLSIIILNYNTKELLKNCLESVFNSKLDDYQMEVIVVDNNSVDGSKKYLKKTEEQKNQLKVIFNDKNIGYSGGNNVGLKHAVGKYILFLNSDTIVEPDGFRKVLDYMEKNPKVGALTPKTILFCGGMDPDCHRGFPTPWASLTYFLGLEKLFPKTKLFGQYHQHYKNLDEIHEMDAGFGTFLLTRKKIIDKLNGWGDEYFFYGEDLDLFYRIKQANWKVVFYPDPIVTHYKGASSGLRKESQKLGVVKADKQTRLRTARESIRAMNIFYNKFYQDKYPRWVTNLILLAIKIKGFFRILKHKLR
jgi:GT2 family glycosyltransferase